jgi:hypothetical protein
MKRLQRLRSTNPALETLAALTIDKGITGELEVIQAAKDIFAVTQDPVLTQFTYKRITMRKLWSLKKQKYESGMYKGKRVFANRDSSKHVVSVLKAQGYAVKFPNNLDFIHNLLKEHKITKFADFKAIIDERSSTYFGTYAQMQIDAMLEYGHLKD